MLLFSALLLCAPAAPAAWQLSVLDWERTRTARYILEIPALSAMMAAYRQAPDSTIVLRYGSDEADILWSEELRHWLVALGVDSAHIRLLAAKVMAETLELELEATR